ncbi:hypothetical protein [Pedobacter duraquae]|uniref:Uncharacterized protein n=1 Tax=Pedobacter duraquae TaxID=425511 RepID=A0A4V3C352_9SPHI|nr:hypothetical protein [Pedobacter duraquae]TDO20709.1 hypothetical protein CLV32_3342 [Pedobacter duraquae]
MSTRPIYELYIDAKGGFFELLVNDIPFYFYYNVGATAFRLNINSFIPKSGLQHLSLRMLCVEPGEPFPEGASVELKIERYEKGNPRERTAVLDYRNMQLSDNKTGIFLHQQSFTAEVPYTLSLANSVSLDNYNEEILRKEMEDAYREYTEAMRTNDLSKYKALTAERQENIFTSLYVDQASRNKQEAGYLKGINHQQVKLYPMQHYKLAFYDNKKLVGLQKIKDAPGIYIDSTNPEDAFIEYIIFHKKSAASPLTIVL